MASRIISADQDDIWLTCLESASTNHVPSPSFNRDYAALYAGKDDKLEAFSFEDTGHSYFVPYVRRLVRSDFSLSKTVCVIESPYGYAGIIASTDDHVFLKHAWEQFTIRMKETDVVAAFLRFDPLLQTHRYFSGPLDYLESKREVVISTLSKNEDILLAGCKGNVRNKINKARRFGVKVRVSKTVEQAMSFVHLYKETMSRLSAMDFYQFESNYFKKLFSRGDTTCLIAELEDIPIGGIIGVRYGENAIVHLSATSEIARTNGTAHLLRYRLMLSMAQMGCKRINLGGGKTEHKMDQLLAHKKGFSNETEKYYSARYPIDGARHMAIVDKWKRSPDFDESRAHLFLPYIDQ